MISLDQVLGLVGRLDDSPGDDTARERFRYFLRTSVQEPGVLRDYAEACLARSTDPQYSRALQDITAWAGQFLGFKVTFGRYQGTASEVGFDALWESDKGFWVVVEVKTSEVYPIPTASLLHYINQLVSQKRIADHENALGLYVIGRIGKESARLENDIVAEKRTQQLRVISLEALLTLAEIVRDSDLQHADILALLKPSRPRLDPIVDLMKRLLFEPKERGPEPAPGGEPALPLAAVEGGAAPSYWVASASDRDEETAVELIQRLVGRERIWAFSDRGAARTPIKENDRIAFYAAGRGFVAHATVATKPVRNPDPRISQPEQFPWVFELRDVVLYADSPVILNAALREQLEAFRGKDIAAGVGWFVQGTRKVSEQDFRQLTRAAPSTGG